MRPFSFLVASRRMTNPCPAHRAPLLEASPCDGCARASRCAAELLACSAFLRFASGASERQWRVLPRTDASADKYRKAIG